MCLIRLFDILFSLLAIIIFLPFLLIISVVIFLDNSGPIFFIQKRVTIDQKLFNFIKFRSMKTSANSNTGDDENYLTIDFGVIFGLQI